jgi:hypothetical protein
MMNKAIKGRYGFEGTCYNNKLYFFFGCQMYDKMRLERTCLNEIIIYDPYSNKLIKRIPYKVPDNSMFTPRKNYASFTLNNTFYCHGGINTKGKVLNKLDMINLDTLEWNTQSYEIGQKIMIERFAERINS